MGYRSIAFPSRRSPVTSIFKLFRRLHIILLWPLLAIAPRAHSGTSIDDIIKVLLNPSNHAQTCDLLLSAASGHSEHPFRSSAFISALTKVNSYWWGQFQSRGWIYEPINYHIYYGSTSTACGEVNDTLGVVYCLADKTLYWSPLYFEQPKIKALLGPTTPNQLHLVLAHEMGHHVQNLRGSYGRYQSHYRLPSTAISPQTLRAMEGMVDCLAGMYLAQHVAQPNTNKRANQMALLEMALRFMTLGDDYLTNNLAYQPQRSDSSGVHGNSVDRLKHLLVGLTASDPSACDPLSPASSLLN